MSIKSKPRTRSMIMKSIFTRNISDNSTGTNIMQIQNQQRVPSDDEIGPGADLSNTDLRYKNLTGANLTGANLTGANLTGAINSCRNDFYKFKSF